MIVLDVLVTALSHVAASGIPDPAPVQPPGTEGFITGMGWLKWGGFALGVVALIVAGVMIMFARQRGEGHDMLQKIGMPVVGVVVVSAAGGIVGALLGG